MCNDCVSFLEEVGEEPTYAVKDQPLKYKKKTEVSDKKSWNRQRMNTTWTLDCTESERW